MAEGLNKVAEDNKDWFKDKRLWGALAAALAAGGAGAFIAPSLIYKKPTVANRATLGLASGVSSFAIVLAALEALDKAPEDNPYKSTTKFIQQLPASFFGGKLPTPRELLEFNKGAGAAWGINNTGPVGWAVRNLFKRPFGSLRSIKSLWTGEKLGDDQQSPLGAAAQTTAAVGLPLFFGTLTRRGLDNVQRVKQFLRVAQQAMGNGALTKEGQTLVKALRKEVNAWWKRPVQAAQALVNKPIQLALSPFKKFLGTYGVDPLTGDRFFQANKNFLGKTFGKVYDRTLRNQLINPYLQVAGKHTTEAWHSVPQRSALGVFKRNTNKLVYDPKYARALKNIAGKSRSQFKGGFKNKLTGLTVGLLSLFLLGQSHAAMTPDSNQEKLFRTEDVNWDTR